MRTCSDQQICNSFDRWSRISYPQREEEQPRFDQYALLLKAYPGIAHVRKDDLSLGDKCGYQGRPAVVPQAPEL